MRFAVNYSENKLTLGAHLIALRRVGPFFAGLQQFKNFCSQGVSFNPHNIIQPYNCFWFKSELLGYYCSRWTEFGSAGWTDVQTATWRDLILLIHSGCLWSWMENIYLLLPWSLWGCADTCIYYCRYLYYWLYWRYEPCKDL